MPPCRRARSATRSPPRESQRRAPQYAQVARDAFLPSGITAGKTGGVVDALRRRSGRIPLFVGLIFQVAGGVRGVEGRGCVYPLFVLALLVSVGAPGAVQASVSCTVKKAPAGSERPIDAVDWYGSPADVRGGVVCRGRVRRDLPERVFRFVTDDNEIQGVTVSGGAGTEQDLHFKDTLTVPPDGNFVRLEDIDFDGYADLGLLERYEPPGNRRWRYRQFNPATGMFRREPLALALVNPRIDRVARTIITHELDGASGRLFTHATLRWSGGTLVPVREEHRAWGG